MIFFKTSEMILSLKKLTSYKYEEQEKLNSINSTLDTINSCFSTDNREKMDEIVNLLESKSVTLKNIHNDNINVLNERINKVEEMQEKSIEVFNEGENKYE